MSSSSGSSKSWSRHQDVDQRFVVTPYGKGIVVATRTKQQQQQQQQGRGSSAGDDEKDLYEKDCLQNRNEILTAIDWTSRNSQKQANNGKPCGAALLVMQVVELLDWDISSSTAASKYPKLYTTSYLPSVQPMVGDDVICTFGRGTIIQLPSSSDLTNTDRTNTISQRHVVVHIKSWRLDDSSRNKVICYLLPQHVYVVRKKTLFEMDVYEKVEHANQFKQEANVCFTNQQYQQAVVKYEKAVDSVRYVQHDADSNNYIRAELVEIMITCSNNAATSCLKLLQASTKASTTTDPKQPSNRESNNYYKESILKNAKNALLLIDALYEKRGQKIHTILKKKYSDIKIFGEWRIKSLLLIAKVHLEKKEYSECVAICKQIKKILEEFTNDEQVVASSTIMAKHEKELQRLLTASMKQVKLEKQKEKKRAQAMFGSSPTKIKKKSVMNGTNEQQHSWNGNDIDGETKQDYTATTKPKKKNVADGTSSLKHRAINNTNTISDDRKSGTMGRNLNTNGSSSSSSNGKRRVSFHETVVDNDKGNYSDENILSNDDEYEEDEEEEDYEQSWLNTNKEALIVGAVASFLALSCLVLLRSSRKK